MCDTLVVRTDDGILFAKNSDRDPNESQVLRWFPAADHAPGTSVACTGATIPQVARTHAIMISAPWWLWGAEMGVNEHGVVIGNEGVFNRAGHARQGLLGMDLVRLALERATTAESAVAVLVELLETHGQGGSHSHDHPRFRYDNSFLVADPKEAIVLETARRSWATEEVTGRVRSISNGYTIESFGRAHADPLRATVARAVARRCRTEQFGADAQGPADLFGILRDHGGSVAPRFHPLNGALGAPCVHAGGLLTASRTAGSWVADLRNDPCHWVTGTAGPCTSIFKPARVDRPTVFAGDEYATNRFDPRVGWWRHERLERRVMRNPAAALARITPERDRLEATWLESRRLGDEPATDEAFVVAERHEADWLDDLVAADLGDMRPAWLRRITTRIEREAADGPVRTWPGEPRPDAPATARSAV